MPTAYPWGALEPLSRAAVRVASGARQALRLEAPRVASALSELLELPCNVVVRKSSLGRVPATGQAVWLCAGTLALGVAAEPALAAFLAARVLRRAEPLANPEEPLSAPLAGLIAALAIETARRSGVATQLLGAPPVGEEALVAEVTLLLEGRPFSLSAYLVGATFEAREATLAELGDIDLSLPLVVATIAIERQELAALEPGGALLLGAGAGIDTTGHGRGVLVAPHSERGIGALLHADGRLVLGEPLQARLSVESDKATPSDGETLTDALLDAPVVVRVELGAVSLSAREWARLGPGDVIETAQRIAEPVVLRIAGREVGRGELVNVDGQVGVRIQKLYEGA
ncbi:MAG TPA: FliM/FliN family flagellar motor switch protein [Polyangiaceae bacterium]|nr:FliM/FliN family flagellar motor switch protein [Polyangiaceae bacterium]